MIDMKWMSAAEAEKRWNLKYGTIRAACIRKPSFRNYERSGLIYKSSVWLISDAAMTNEYGKEKDIEFYKNHSFHRSIKWIKENDYNIYEILLKKALTLKQETFQDIEKGNMEITYSFKEDYVEFIGNNEVWHKAGIIDLNYDQLTLYEKELNNK
jgi:hypothetical protein